MRRAIAQPVVERDEQPAVSFKQLVAKADEVGVRRGAGADSQQFVDALALGASTRPRRQANQRRRRRAADAGAALAQDGAVEPCTCRLA